MVNTKTRPTPVSPTLACMLGCYDVLISIASHCHHSDLVSLMLTCKAIHQSIANASDIALSLTCGVEKKPCPMCRKVPICRVMGPRWERFSSWLWVRIVEWRITFPWIWRPNKGYTPGDYALSARIATGTSPVSSTFVKGPSSRTASVNGATHREHSQYIPRGSAYFVNWRQNLRRSA